MKLKKVISYLQLKIILFTSGENAPCQNQHKRPIFGRASVQVPEIIKKNLFLFYFGLKHNKR